MCFICSMQCWLVFWVIKSNCVLNVFWVHSHLCSELPTDHPRCILVPSVNRANIASYDLHKHNMDFIYCIIKYGRIRAVGLWSCFRGSLGCSVKSTSFREKVRQSNILKHCLRKHMCKSSSNNELIRIVHFKNCHHFRRPTLPSSLRNWKWRNSA